MTKFHAKFLIRGLHGPKFYGPARPGPVYIDCSRGFSSWQWPRRKLVVLAKSRRPMWSCVQPGTDVLFMAAT